MVLFGKILVFLQKIKNEPRLVDQGDCRIGQSVVANLIGCEPKGINKQFDACLLDPNSSRHLYSYPKKELA